MLQAICKCVFVTLSMFTVIDDCWGQDEQNQLTSMGELHRYAGDWFVAEHRNNFRVTADHGDNWIETYFRGGGSCGCFQWSMKMSYDESKETYSAKIKWSNYKNGYVSHSKLSWREFNMVGNWNAETKTMTWTEVVTDNLPQQRVVETVIDSETQQTLRFRNSGSAGFPGGGYNFYRLW